MIKLMFHKINKSGIWIGEIFNNTHLINDYTEKVPPNTGYEWNEELNEWELIPIENENFNIVEIEEIENSDNENEET